MTITRHNKAALRYDLAVAPEETMSGDSTDPPSGGMTPDSADDDLLLRSLVDQVGLEPQMPPQLYATVL